MLPEHDHEVDPLLRGSTLHWPKEAVDDYINAVKQKLDRFLTVQFHKRIVTLGGLTYGVARPFFLQLIIEVISLRSITFKNYYEDFSLMRPLTSPQELLC